MTAVFPPLGNWEPTRQTLHRCALAVSVVPRAHAVPHPKWWHIALLAQPDGLRTREIALPDGGSFNLFMDLTGHTIQIHQGEKRIPVVDITAGLTGTHIGEAVISAVSGLGLEGRYAREKFEDGEAGQYDPQAASAFLQAVNLAQKVFAKHRAALSGETGPVQLWPHGFDLAFEWFGTKQISYEEHGETFQTPAQLNLGFSLGEPGHPEPYFYSNPWPFAGELLTAQALPPGASWYTNSWQGSLLPYAALAGDPLGPQRLFEYAQRVFALASPTLMNSSI